MAETKEIDFKKVATPHWAAFQPEHAFDDEKNEFLRKNLGGDKTIVYKRDAGKEDWKCMTCGSKIIVTRVAHTVRDGIFPLSGSGKVKNEDVPYCPKCEEKPAFHGQSIPPR